MGIVRHLVVQIATDWSNNRRLVETFEPYVEQSKKCQSRVRGRD